MTREDLMKQIRDTLSSDDSISDVFGVAIRGDRIVLLGTGSDDEGDIWVIELDFVEGELVA